MQHPTQDIEPISPRRLESEDRLEIRPIRRADRAAIVEIDAIHSGAAKPAFWWATIERALRGSVVRRDAVEVLAFFRAAGFRAGPYLELELDL